MNEKLMIGATHWCGSDIYLTNNLSSELILTMDVSEIYVCLLIYDYMHDTEPKPFLLSGDLIFVLLLL